MKPSIISSVVFPPASDSYIGRYENPIIYQKRLRFGAPARGAKRRPYIPPYYPARAARR